MQNGLYNSKNCYIFFFGSVDLNVFPAILYANCCNDEFKMEPLSYKRMDFEEFCAAAISTYQLEALEGWEDIASTAFEYFEQEGNRAISVMELAQVCASDLNHVKVLIKFPIFHFFLFIPCVWPDEFDLEREEYQSISAEVDE
jgi:hypothetical protein